MSETTALSLTRQAIVIALVVGGPMLVLSLVVGLVISIFQTTTQLNEQTLTFVPKIVAVAVAALIFGPFMLQTLLRFASGILVNLSGYLH